jgi:hypothetical protein
LFRIPDAGSHPGAAADLSPLLRLAPITDNLTADFTGWLEDRLESVYKKDPTFSDKATSMFVLDLGPPEKLPDALRGERWSFVQLPLSALKQELDLVKKVGTALILISPLRN